MNKTNSTDSTWNLSNMNPNHSNTYSSQNDFNSDLTDSKQNANYVLPSIHNQHIVSTVDRFRSVLTNHRLSPYSTAYHNNSYTNSSNSLNYNQSTETDSLSVIFILYHNEFMNFPFSYIPSSFRLRGYILPKIKVIFVILVFGLVGIDSKIMILFTFNVHMFCLFPPL
jgi:hypothetical protein